MENTGKPYVHHRTVRSITAALMRPKLYSGVARMFLQSINPVDFLLRYVRVRRTYPAKLFLRSPIGPVEITAFSETDVDTVNEIFFWNDYGAKSEECVIVDFGANVGISALFFLSRNEKTKVYCYEPLPQNVSRLRHNLRAYSDRYELVEAAVCDSDGTANFGWESTGKFGGVDLPSPQRMQVLAVSSNRVLADIIARHGEIDVLKMDVEGTEGSLTVNLPTEIASRIRRITMEFQFAENPLPQTHEMSLRWPITTLVRRDPVSA